MNTQLLKKGHLFEGLDAAELEAMAEIVKEKDVIMGDSIFDEGSAATSLYVIKSGSVEILKKGSSGDEQLVTHFSTGSHFGEMSFLDHEPRGASAIAKENTKLLEISYKDIEKVMSAKPAVGTKIYKALALGLCRRIRSTTNSLASLRDLKLRHV